MNKQIKEKLIKLLSECDESTTGSSHNWTVDGTNYSLSLSLYGGNLTISGNAYRPDPPAVMRSGDTFDMIAGKSV